MVSPVTNGLPQPVPASNTFQPGGKTDSAQEKENRETLRADTAQESSLSARASETSRTDDSRQTVSASSRDDDNGRTTARTDRGSVFDVVV